MRAHTSARIALKEIELKVCSTKSLDAAMQLKKILKSSKNRNDFMNTSTIIILLVFGSNDVFKKSFRFLLTFTNSHSENLNSAAVLFVHTLF